MWFRANRKKLIKRLVEDIIEDYSNRLIKKKWTMYLSDITIKQPNDEVLLGSAHRREKAVVLYLIPITNMIVNRIHRLITHEFNHLKGYAEKGAEKYAKKEKKYKELK